MVLDRVLDPEPCCLRLRLSPPSSNDAVPMETLKKKKTTCTKNAVHTIERTQTYGRRFNTRGGAWEESQTSKRRRTQWAPSQSSKHRRQEGHFLYLNKKTSPPPTRNRGGRTSAREPPLPAATRTTHRYCSLPLKKSPPSRYESTTLPPGCSPQHKEQAKRNVTKHTTKNIQVSHPPTLQKQ